MTEYLIKELTVPTNGIVIILIKDQTIQYLVTFATGVYSQLSSISSEVKF